MKIYEKTPEEYFGFIPPGGLEDWHKYRDYRIRFSETIGPESPLVRRTFDGINGLNGRPDFVRAMSSSAVSMLMSRRWMAMGLPAGIREFKMCHDFRLLFRTRIKTPGIIDKEDAEHMTGHKDPYIKPEFLDTGSDEFNGLLLKFEVLPQGRTLASLSKRRELQHRPSKRKWKWKARSWTNCDFWNSKTKSTGEKITSAWRETKKILGKL